MKAISDYQGLSARIYDAVWESEYEDQPFYSWLLGPPSGKLLELGCGTGRVLLPLAMEGWRCVGVDASPDMLEICRLKADEDNLPVELHRQRIERLKLATKFDRIIIPGFTFQHLTEIPTARRALRRIRDHLKARGRLILSLFHPWETLRNGNDGHWKLRSSTALEDGNRVLVHESTAADPVLQHLTIWNRYEMVDAGGRPVEEALVENKLRWFGLDEFRLLLEAAGFDRIEVYGDFAPSPPKEGHSFFTFDARPTRRQA
jgi:SAM-dependent methyltransferase